MSDWINIARTTTAVAALVRLERSRTDDLVPPLDYRFISQQLAHPGREAIAIHSQTDPDRLLAWALIAHETTLEILHIAVDPQYRRQTIGQHLIKMIISMAHSFGAPLGTRIVSALAEERNLPYQLLLKSCGFLYRRTIQHPAGNDWYFFTKGTT